MEHENELCIAATVKPVIDFLRKRGIVVVGAVSIHVTEEFFREVWPDVEPDEYGILNAEYGGVEFTTFVHSPGVINEMEELESV